MKILLSLLSCLLVACSAQVDPNVEALDYDDNGYALQGFKSTPDGASADNQVPAVVVIPDWDGVNLYEQQRATMIASELGYVGFAADIYGKDLHFVEDIEQRRELANLYRSNATLFTSRIQAAVDFVRTFPEVDTENVAIIGYCFGGTGVLTYALVGINDVKAVVSFHGGLGSIPEAGPAVTPKVLVLSGGEDDASTDIMDLETTLNASMANWEITRYSQIEHAFTVFGDERYNEWADMRSWESMTEFLKEAFGERSFSSTPPATVDVEPVPYTDVDGTQLQGYLAMPELEWQRPLPAIIIVPDWDGNNQYEKERATLLAELGYVGFAADIYGADLQEVSNFTQRMELASKYRNNPPLFVQRMERAIEEVKKVDGVDTENMAAIGYCFGGTGVIELAFSGNDDVKAVVSFHGGHRTLPNASQQIFPYTLVLSGGIDDAHGNQTIMEASLNAGNASWEITRYSEVDHGFTKWDSDAYSPKADVRSWESMLTAFEELMPIPVKATDGSDFPTSVPAPSIAGDMPDLQSSVPTIAPFVDTPTSDNGADTSGAAWPAVLSSLGAISFVTSFVMFV